MHKAWGRHPLFGLYGNCYKFENCLNRLLLFCGDYIIIVVLYVCVFRNMHKNDGFIQKGDVVICKRNGTFMCMAT